MFETLFKYPRVLARHREGPVADARERFLTHCAEQGLARESLLRTAREVQHDQCLRGDRSGDEDKSSGKVPSY